MNKKQKIIIQVIIGIIFVYVIFKQICVLTYTKKDFDSNSKITIGNTIELKTNKLNENEYITFNNIKIRNDFKNYEKTNKDNEVTYRNNNNIMNIIISSQTYIDKLNTKEVEDKIYKTIDIKKILNKNNIKNDIDLFRYISNYKFNSNNIFASLYKIKESYFAKYISIAILPDLSSPITFLNGSYNGYIFNVNDNFKQVNILKDDKVYTFNFSGYDDKYIIDLLNTVVIN